MHLFYSLLKHVSSFIKFRKSVLCRVIKSLKGTYDFPQTLMLSVYVESCVRPFIEGSNDLTIVLSFSRNVFSWPRMNSFLVAADVC